MKLINLTLSNIHSLKGPYSIPFTSGILGDAGLFVISGPTGSGKSSILDAITLALYNRIPRVSVPINSSVIEKQGVVLSQYARECFVELEYEVDAIRYRSHWSIKYRSTGTLEERKHELVYADSNEIISNSLNEIIKKTEEIIGLTYEQFVQSMVLAQGQFDRLLKANKNDRNKLLEEITGGSIYRSIGLAVYIRNKSLIDQEKILQTRIDEVNVLTDAQLKEYNLYIKTNEPALKLSQTEIKEIESSRTRKEGIQKKQTELGKLEDEIILNGNQWKEFATSIELLARHEEASAFRTSINEWKDLDKTRSSSTTDFIKNQDFLKLANEDKEEAISAAGSLVNKELNAASLNSELELFRTEIESLIKSESTSEVEVKNAHINVQRIVERIHLAGHSAFELENTPEQTKEFINEIDRDFKDAGLTIESDIQIELHQVTSKIDQIRNLFLFKENYDSASKNHADAKDLLKIEEAKVQLADDQLNDTTAKLEILEPELQILRNEVEKLILQRGLDDHRSHLIDGEPCPLCGSKEHPLIQELQEQIEGEKEKLLKAKDALVSSLRTLKIQSENTIQTLESVINKQKEAVLKKGQALSSSETLLKELSEQLGWQSTDDVEIWQKEKSKIEIRFAKLSQLENKKTLRKELLDFIVQKEKLDKVDLLFKEATSKREGRYKGVDLSRDVQNALSTFQKAQNECDQLTKRIRELSDAIESANKDILALENELIPKINAKGFETLQRLFEALLSHADADTIRKHREALSKNESEITGSIKQLIKELDELKQQDDASISLEELLVKISDMNEAIMDMNTKIIEAKKVLDEDAKRQVYFEQLMQERTALKKDVSLWKRLNSLIGDAKGNKFANYVQELTLEQLIQYANGHLKGLTDRYQIMKPDKDNLRVADMHLGGTLRDVVTLSGGETFKLSLALAFALSDLASQNVQIESLFIDEGFGSLDPDSLDDAIGVLEDIQSKGNKSIGIISHVGELKERISAKIKLQPTGTGYSDLQIVNE
jgi:exonuclease SbcC